MKVHITIDGPGSSGELMRDVTEEQFKFLTELAEEWNEANGFHAQPYIGLHRMGITCAPLNDEQLALALGATEPVEFRIRPWAVPNDESERGKDEAIDRLRGQLQNCVNLLHRLKRHGYASDVVVADKAIEAANRALYETLDA